MTPPILTRPARSSHRSLGAFLLGAACTLAERSGESAESAEEQAAETGRNEGASAQEHSEEEEFRPLGFNLESTPLLAAGAVLSLVLAALVVKRPRREVLSAVLVLAAAFTALEIGEVQHQASIEETGILAFGLIAGVLHGGTAVLAGLALMSGRRTSLQAPIG